MATTPPVPDSNVPGENPLVPNAVLQALDAMMQALRKEGSRTRTPVLCPRGQEAVYASSLLSLRPSDVVSSTAAPPKSLDSTGRPLWLKHTPTEPTRLSLALGAAALLRAQGAGDLLLAFVEADDLSPAAWKQLLGVAGEQSLPIIFVALAAARPGQLSSRAQGWGVPGIPVDATDAVALYRVLQESVLRARHGDGPALLEPVMWTLDGPPADPLKTMRQLLRRRGLAGSTRATSSQGIIPPSTGVHRSK